MSNEFTSRSRRLRLGRRDRFVPDRGRRQRGRPRRERVGPLLRDARQGAKRRHGRDGVRLLPPLPRRHRADARARARRVPVLDRLAARHSRRTRQGERAGPRLLRPAGRRAPRQRHRAVRDALPLGHAAGDRGRGGWPARDTVDAFAEYVEAVAGRLGDRVGHWITHNEPWVVSWVGHGWGHHAPGRTSDSDALATAHHLLLSHGRAVEILRELSPKSEVGITLNLDMPYPATEEPGTSAPPGGSTGCTTAGSSTRCSAGPIPRTWRKHGATTFPRTRG